MFSQFNLLWSTYKRSPNTNVFRPSIYFKKQFAFMFLTPCFLAFLILIFSGILLSFQIESTILKIFDILRQNLHFFARFMFFLFINKAFAFWWGRVIIWKRCTIVCKLREFCLGKVPFMDQYSEEGLALFLEVSLSILHKHVTEFVMIEMHVHGRIPVIQLLLN